MFKWFKSLFSGKDINDVLKQRRRVKIKGVIFIIRKINILDFLEGSKAAKQIYDTYKISKDITPQSMNKLNEHYKDVILAGVVHPKLCRKENEVGVHIDEVLNDAEMAAKLYLAIDEFTYGKKKVKYFSKERLVELDSICKRYSKFPSEAMKLPIEDFDFSALVAQCGIGSEIEAQKSINKALKNSRKR